MRSMKSKSLRTHPGISSTNFRPWRTHTDSWPSYPRSKTLSVVGRVADRHDADSQSIVAPAPVKTGGIRWLVLSAYAATIAANFVCNTGVLWGNNIAQVSAMHTTPLTPADWTFAIWGVIYTTQGMVALYLAQPQNTSQNVVKTRALKALGPWWTTGWACQTVWLVLFCRNTPLALAACVALLVGATLSFSKAILQTEKILKDDTAEAFPRPAQLLLKSASSINAAWASVATGTGICIAAQANSSTDLVLLSIVLATAIGVNGAYMVLSRKNVLYGLTLIWSFAGLYAAQASSSDEIKIASLTAIAALTVVSIRQLRRAHT